MPQPDKKRSSSRQRYASEKNIPLFGEPATSEAFNDQLRAPELFVEGQTQTGGSTTQYSFGNLAPRNPDQDKFASLEEIVRGGRQSIDFFSRFMNKLDQDNDVELKKKMAETQDIRKVEYYEDETDKDGNVVRDAQGNVKKVLVQRQTSDVGELATFQSRNDELLRAGKNPVYKIDTLSPAEVISKFKTSAGLIKGRGFNFDDNRDNIIRQYNSVEEKKLTQAVSNQLQFIARDKTIDEATRQQKIRELMIGQPTEIVMLGRSLLGESIATVEETTDRLTIRAGSNKALNELDALVTQYETTGDPRVLEQIHDPNAAWNNMGEIYGPASAEFEGITNLLDILPQDAASALISKLDRRTASQFETFQNTQEKINGKLENLESIQTQRQQSANHEQAKGQVGNARGTHESIDAALDIAQTGQHTGVAVESLLALGFGTRNRRITDVVDEDLLNVFLTSDNQTSYVSKSDFLEDAISYITEETLAAAQAEGVGDFGRYTTDPNDPNFNESQAMLESLTNQMGTQLRAGLGDWYEGTVGAELKPFDPGPNTSDEDLVSSAANVVANVGSISFEAFNRQLSDEELKPLEGLQDDDDLFQYAEAKSVKDLVEIYLQDEDRTTREQVFVRDVLQRIANADASPEDMLSKAAEELFRLNNRRESAQSSRNTGTNRISSQVGRLENNLNGASHENIFDSLSDNRPTDNPIEVAAVSKARDRATIENGRTVSTVFGMDETFLNPNDPNRTGITWGGFLQVPTPEGESVNIPAPSTDLIASFPRFNAVFNLAKNSKDATEFAEAWNAGNFNEAYPGYTGKKTSDDAFALLTTIQEGQEAFHMIQAGAFGLGIGADGSFQRDPQVVADNREAVVRGIDALNSWYDSDPNITNEDKADRKNQLVALRLTLDPHSNNPETTVTIQNIGRLFIEGNQYVGDILQSLLDDSVERTFGGFDQEISVIDMPGADEILDNPDLQASDPFEIASIEERLQQSRNFGTQLDESSSMLKSLMLQISSITGSITDEDSLANMPEESRQRVLSVLDMAIGSFFYQGNINSGIVQADGRITDFDFELGPLGRQAAAQIAGAGATDNDLKRAFRDLVLGGRDESLVDIIQTLSLANQGGESVREVTGSLMLTAALAEVEAQAAVGAFERNRDEFRNSLLSTFLFSVNNSGALPVAGGEGSIAGGRMPNTYLSEAMLVPVTDSNGNVTYNFVGGAGKNFTPENIMQMLSYEIAAQTNTAYGDKITSTSQVGNQFDFPGTPFGNENGDWFVMSPETYLRKEAGENVDARSIKDDLRFTSEQQSLIQAVGLEMQRAIDGAGGDPSAGVEVGLEMLSDIQSIYDQDFGYDPRNGVPMMMDGTGDFNQEGDLPLSSARIHLQHTLSRSHNQGDNRTASAKLNRLRMVSTSLSGNNAGAAYVGGEIKAGRVATYSRQIRETRDAQGEARSLIQNLDGFVPPEADENPWLYVTNNTITFTNQAEAGQWGTGTATSWLVNISGREVLVEEPAFRLALGTELNKIMQQANVDQQFTGNSQTGMTVQEANLFGGYMLLAKREQVVDSMQRAQPPVDMDVVNGFFNKLETRLKDIEEVLDPRYEVVDYDGSSQGDTLKRPTISDKRIIYGFLSPETGRTEKFNTVSSPYKNPKLGQIAAWTDAGEAGTHPPSGRYGYRIFRDKADVNGLYIPIYLGEGNFINLGGIR